MTEVLTTVAMSLAGRTMSAMTAPSEQDSPAIRPPRFPDGWNWDPLSGENGAWLYFRHGRYCAWVMPKLGLFVANWRLGHRTWMHPYGEDPRHLYTNPYEAMQYAQAMAVSE